ncbi:hypothetical protein [Rhodohalobacter halophilus]|uniref:hypothetical protein n=1 Tax=Rhodohalobacter halophilus TaxID=1812810 RepID=UPI00083FC4A1|nr:hypothetical protein [Rhodohalobacter halophilus]
MCKIFKISLLISLFGISAGLSPHGQAIFGQSTEWVQSGFDVAQQHESTLYGKPVLPIFFAEFHSDSNSESDPDQHSFLRPDWITVPKDENGHYLQLQKLIDHSQSVRQLLFPYHTHL